MARDKKSMIGFDPLAWLDDKPQSSEDVASVNQTSEKDTKIKQSTAAKKSAKKKTEAIKLDFLNKNIDESALLKGYELLEQSVDEVTTEFLNAAISQQAEIFENIDSDELVNHLQNAISLMIEHRHDELHLINELQKMAVSCQAQNVMLEHFLAGTEIFLTSCKQSGGRAWTKAVSAAWNDLLLGVAETICAAYIDNVTEVENTEMDTADMTDDVKPDNIKPVESEMNDEPVESDHPVLQLNSVQDISKSQALKNDMLKLINDNDEIDIDASEVERIDGSALQLLCALFNYAAQNNLVIHWVNPTDAFKQAVETLGVQNILELG